MFPDILKNLRMKKNMSQQELADIVGKTQQAVYLWEKGENEPGIESLNILADFFGVTTDFLLGRQTEIVAEEGLFYGLDEDEQKAIRGQADYYRYRKNLPKDEQADSSGLTNTDKKGEKIRLKRENPNKTDKKRKTVG